MAKGDREILKADTDDGYTKIADLLLEALAMSKLNGVQKGICLFLWRRTYGWEQKEDQISLKEFAQACDSEESYMSKQLKQLVVWNVILRTSYQPGKIPTYAFNTRVDQWNKGCLNRQGLSECTRQGLFKRTRQGLSDQTRVDSGSDLEPQGFEAPLYTSYKQDNNSNGNSNTHAQEKELNQPQKETITIYQSFEKEFGRPLSPIELDKINNWMTESQEFIIREALKRAVLAGKFSFSYIDSILLRWKKNNIRTIQQIELDDTEFRKGGNQRGGKPPRGPTANRADTGASNDGPRSKYLKSGAKPPEV